MKTFNIVNIALCISIFLISCTDMNIAPDDNTSKSDKGDYKFIAKYDSIRTFPNGAGVFVLKIKPNSDFDGSVKLKIIANDLLGATLDKTCLSSKDTVVNIYIKPSDDIEKKTYEIEVLALHSNIEKRIKLKIIVFDWQNGNAEVAIEKFELFKNWIDANKPEYSEIFNLIKNKYLTYPEILIVEHWTFINSLYEVRFCFHVMVPPDDWSMLQVRKLKKFEPDFSLFRDTYGNIKEISNAEYPTFFGY